MKQRYHITPGGGERLTDAEVARYKDHGRLQFNYQRAAKRMHEKPLYKDRRAFIALLIIVLLALFIAEVVEKEHRAPSPDREQPAP